MEGRHVHPSTLYPWRGTTATIQLMTDYMTRLMRYVEFMKKVVPMHDDLFDFFYEALPGYEKVGLPHPARLLGLFQDPEHCNFNYKDMEAGAARCSSPRVSSSTASWSRRRWWTSTSASESCWAVRITTTGPIRRCSSRSIRSAIRWTGATRGTSTPTRTRRSGTWTGKYSWVMSPRWFDGKDHLALDTGGGPLARLWATALAGLVDIGYVKATGNSVQINLPKTALKGPVGAEWKIPQHGSNTIERDRAWTYFQAYAAACALHRGEGAGGDPRGPHQDLEKFEVPDEGIGCGFTEAVRGVLSHHMVIRDGKIANYHPYPPTPWNASPRDSYGTPGRMRMRYRVSRSSRRTTGSTSRVSTSCARCAVSTRVCPAGCTCTSATERPWTSCTPPSPQPGNSAPPLLPGRNPGRRAVAHGGRSDTDTARRERGGGTGGGTRRTTGP